MRNAKIVCTLGPASADEETIAAMADAGMAVARLNASHGTTDERAALLEVLDRVQAARDEPLATMLDLGGPEVRTVDVDGELTIAAGDRVRLVQDDVLTAQEIGVTVPLGELREGTTVLFDDGRLEATVTDATPDGPLVTFESGGSLGGSAGVNLPGVILDIDVVTPADEDELDLAVESGVDFVAASFVTDGEDVLAVSEAIEARGGDIPIVAKIERDAAVANIDSIIDAAHGLMVARGDLGVECPLEDVPIIQKRLIRRGHEAGVPVITATEMLDSMIEQSRPTRAEASDVANAVLDGTDAVMLSGETAIGERPVAVVETMATLVRTIEASEEYADLREQRVPPVDAGNTDAIARSARFLARDIGADAVVVASESGYTALKAAKYRPGVPIIAVAGSERVERRLALSWGIHPLFHPTESDDVIEAAVQAALESPTVGSGDTLVVLSGVMTDIDRETANTLQVHIAAERIGVGAGVVAGQVAGPIVTTDDGHIDEIPSGAILYLDESFAEELWGELDQLAGIIHERPGMTGYAAVVARELGIPMASGLVLPSSIEPGDTVTLYGDRGVVYRGDVLSRRRLGR